MTVDVFSGVFDRSEIDALTAFYHELPVSNSRYHTNGQLIRTMKHSQYNLTDRTPYKILSPKLQTILGQHEFSGGHYMDAHLPFELHVDSISAYKRNAVKIFDAPAQQNKGVLIPLSENVHFHTVFFQHYRDKFDMSDIYDVVAGISPPVVTESWLDLMDHHDPDWFDCIGRLTLDRVASWHLGDVICWSRNQLHCSSNFAKHGLTKQAIVLWI